MITFLRKTFRRVAFGGLTLGLMGFIVPTAYEARHNENQQDKITASMNKIVQEQYFACDPGAAGSQKDTRDKALLTATVAAFPNLNPGWSQPLDLFQSGLKRMTNSVPNATGFVSHYAKVPEDYRSGNYATELDDLAAYTTSLGNLGVGVCFDSNLNKIGAGSAYAPKLGVITLNPDMSAGDLAEHARRQLQHLNQELVLPYERLVKNGNDLTSTFNEHFSQLRILAAQQDGPVITLPLNAGAHGADFVEVPAKDYSPPLLTQPPAEPEKVAAAGPAAAVKAPKAHKK